MVFHNLWHLYFNPELLTVEELSRRGIEVASGETPREALIRSLHDIAGTIRDESSGRTYPVELTVVAEGAVGRVPDMLVRGTHSDYQVDFWNIARPRDAVVNRLVGSERHFHARNGIFAIWGDGVRGGFYGGEKGIENVAPTILHLLGLPVAPDMDGAPMTDLLEGPAASLPVLLNAGYRDLPRAVAPEGPDRESLQKKLRSLGYIR